MGVVELVSVTPTMTRLEANRWFNSPGKAVLREAVERRCRLDSTFELLFEM